MSKLRLSRRSLGVGAIAAVVAVGILTTVVVTGAKAPSASRWNHTNSHVAPGAVAENNAEGQIPAGSVWQTLEFNEPYGDKLAFVDVGPGGDSVGDYVVFRDKVTDPNTEEVKGRIDVTCMNGFADMCRGTVRLTGQGQIVFEGMTPIGVDPDHYPIVGGGGAYVDVGGVLTISFPADDYAHLTLTLTH